MSTTTASSSPTSLPDRGERSAGRGPLYETASTTATDYWNDSCSVEELTYAIDAGRSARRATRPSSARC